jgi:hypothetical protein
MASKQYPRAFHAPVDDSCAWSSRCCARLRPRWKRRAARASLVMGVSLLLANCSGENDSDDEEEGTGECAGAGCAQACVDGIDNDQDGYVDCADQDCATFGACVGAGGSFAAGGSATGGTLGIGGFVTGGTTSSFGGTPTGGTTGIGGYRTGGSTAAGGAPTGGRLTGGTTAVGGSETGGSVSTGGTSTATGGTSTATGGRNNAMCPATVPTDGATCEFEMMGIQCSYGGVTCTCYFPGGTLYWVCENR